MTGAVYALYDPRDGAVRYIGKAVNFKKRLSAHIRESLNGSDSTYKGRWIRKMVEDGVRPALSVLMTCASRHYLNEMEKTLIRVFRSRGARLTNLTPGGEGGGYTPTLETRQKLSDSMKRRAPFTAETRARMSAAGRAKTITVEHRAKLAASLKAIAANLNVQSKRSATLKSSQACIAQRARLHASTRGTARPPHAVAITAAACRKPVVDQHGTVYDSITDAAQAIGVSPSNISTIIAGRRRHTRGYEFRLLETK